MDKIIQYQTERIKTEFDFIDNRLRIILYALSSFVYHKFGKSIILTDLLRTSLEQLAIYPDKPNQVSVHQEGRGADVSVKWFTDEECSDILKFLNTAFEYNNLYKTALIHDVGQGNHLHIQVNYGNFTYINRIRTL
jgi:hypothetical protein